MKGAPARVTNIVTTQRTGKKWKLLKLLSQLAVIAGVFLLVASTAVSDDRLLGIGWGLLLGGGCGWLLARLGIWWQHE